MSGIQLPSRVYCRNVFLAALAGSVLLMASGFFIGTIGIDDELNVLDTVFDGTGRGLWMQHLITWLLPGQLGISFAPAAIGCLLYAASIAVTVSLWGTLKKVEVAYVAAALIGGFPYFASMMSFDVAQVAYPLGFLLMAGSLIPVFCSRRLVTLGWSILAFGLAFACYQGVATTFATAWASIIGMRYLMSEQKSRFLKDAARVVLPRTIVTALLGSLFYLLTVKLSQAIVPYAEWQDGYRVKTNFSLFEPGRLASIVSNVKALLLGGSGDLPFVAAILFLAGVAILSASLLFDRTISLPERVGITLAFGLSVFVLPFWILGVQSMSLTPRSSVGLGILFGYVFAALALRFKRRALALLLGCAAIVGLQFMFTGNQMYYTQFLASQADQVTVSRIAARIDTVARENRLKIPIVATFVGRYSPAGGRFAKYDTIGWSPLTWDNGSIERQAALFSLYGVDYVFLDPDPVLRDELVKHVVARRIPSWPDPESVFLFKDSVVAVNLGGVG